MIGDYFKLALDSITHRKLRSWLTMLGIFIGVMAVVALISLGEGLQSTINEEFEKIGSNRVIITPGGGGGEAALFAAGGFSSETLTSDDVDVVKDVRGVEYATGAMRKTVNLEFADENKYTTLICVSTDEDSLKLFEDMPYFMVEEGKMLEKGDRYRTVVGKTLTEDFFDKEVNVNDKITIEGGEFTVIGTFKKAGNPVHDEKVVLTEEMCEEMFNLTEVSMITVTVKDGHNVTQVADAMKEKLRRHRGLKKDEEDFTISTPEDMMRIFLSIIDMVQLVLTGIAAISLLVGGIGIMNTMYTSVLERTSEIGIMKAVGAKNGDILALFMIEAGLIGTVGGAVGTAFGLGLAKMVEYLAVYSGLELLKVQVSMELVLGALAFSFIVGSLSGVMPAYRAAKMNPVEALRQ